MSCQWWGGLGRRLRAAGNTLALAGGLAGSLVRVALVAGAVCAVPAGAARAAEDWTPRYDAIAAAQGREPEAVRLHRLFKLEWDWVVTDSPETATFIGDPRGQDRWTDLSPATLAARREHVAIPLRVLATIDPAGLGAVDRTSYAIFQRQLEEARDGARFPGELLALNQLQGVQQDPAQLLGAMSKASVPALENQLARLVALPAVIDQTIALLEQGLAKGITPPAIVLRDIPDQVRAQLTAEPRQSPLLRGFLAPDVTVPGEEAERLQRAAATVVAEKVQPAYTRLLTFLETKYLPAARTAIAATALPDGEAWYAWQVRTQTSTTLTPREIHAIGLREVTRIRAEMERVKLDAGFKGTLAEFFTFLRTDPQFYFTDKEDLLRAYRDISKRADPELVRLFGTLPRTPYGVVPVPADAEKSQTTAYYWPGALDAGRPGRFFANTYALHTRPKWEMEALTLHEAVPGHHLQISLAQELGELPEFRRYGGYTAFVEGWGLYSESLGEEMGFYRDPYQKFGQLTYEMWRAVRLVVDTGMHALGWTREQAIQFFKDNASKSEHDITVEIDRYIAWPGQALAYKIGELKIKELRSLATRELGPRFDVRRFHDEVLRHGAVPLDVLETQVRTWIAAEQAKG